LDYYSLLTFADSIPFSFQSCCKKPARYAILPGTGWHRLWAMLSLIIFRMLEKTKQIKIGYMQATKVELIVNLRLPEINPP